MSFGDLRKSSDASLAYFFLRVTFGTNILMHGVSRIISGTGRFASTLAQSFRGVPFTTAACDQFRVCIAMDRNCYRLSCIHRIVNAPSTLCWCGSHSGADLWHYAASGLGNRGATADLRNHICRLAGVFGREQSFARRALPPAEALTRIQSALQCIITDNRSPIFQQCSAMEAPIASRVRPELYPSSAQGGPGVNMRLLTSRAHVPRLKFVPHLV